MILDMEGLLGRKVIDQAEEVVTRLMVLNATGRLWTAIEKNSGLGIEIEKLIRCVNELDAAANSAPSPEPPADHAALPAEMPSAFEQMCRSYGFTNDIYTMWRAYRELRNGMMGERG